MNHILESFFLVTAILAGVPLAAAAGCGVVIALLQALTQIQDQTLPQLVKVVAIGLCLLLLGRALVTPLMVESAEIFETFWTYGR